MPTQTNAMTRRELMGLLGALGAAAVVPSGLGFAASEPKPSWKALFAWQGLPRDVPGFLLASDLATGGATLLARDGSDAVLIDTKFGNLGPALAADVRALRGPRTSLSVINTHHHGDHIGGNAFILPHADHSYAHTNAIERIRSQVELAQWEATSGVARMEKAGAPPDLIAYARIAAESVDQITPESVTPSIPVGEETSLRFGGSRITLHHFGAGHTDNDLVVVFENHGVIQAGDLVFNGTHPFFFPSGGATVIGWLKSLRSLLGICDAKAQVIPGHGPAGDRSIVVAQIEYLERLVEHVQREIDTGTPKENAQEMSWAFMEGLEFGSARPRAIGAVYDELTGG